MSSGSGKMFDSTLRGRGVKMLFVPFVRVSLLSMVARQICGTTCKEVIPPFMHMILDSLKLIQ